MSTLLFPVMMSTLLFPVMFANINILFLSAKPMNETTSTTSEKQTPEIPIISPTPDDSENMIETSDILTEKPMKEIENPMKETTLMTSKKNTTEIPAFIRATEDFANAILNKIFDVITSIFPVDSMIETTSTTSENQTSLKSENQTTQKTGIPKIPQMFEDLENMMDIHQNPNHSIPNDDMQFSFNITYTYKKPSDDNSEERSSTTINTDALNATSFSHS